ncbi:MAG: signal peptidase I [Gemmataceae bacterium]|nr:signal peptidase I [Gemmataceae bacterium]
MLTLAMLLGILVGSLLVSAGILWVCARLVRAGKPTFKRAVACVVVLAVFGIAFQVLAAAVFGQPAASGLVIAAVDIVIALLLIWVIFARMFQITFARAMLLSLPYLVASVAFSFGLIYLLTRYCFTAYIIPTNAMAPTLIGWHHETTCPHCSGVAIISGRPPDDEFAQLERFDPLPKPGICTNCRKISEFKHWPPELHGPMRIICNLQMQPQRGDVTVFRYPPQPETLYVKRLIGLPGEKIEIKDDAVWINGTKWTPPPELVGLAYYSDPVDREREPRSWELGPDEFFVLGDFTTNSSDSRAWGFVPRANLVGVATVIYLPPSGWRVLR